jgi:hypothetical protein
MVSTALARLVAPVVIDISCLRNNPAEVFYVALQSLDLSMLETLHLTEDTTVCILTIPPLKFLKLSQLTVRHPMDLVWICQVVSTVLVTLYRISLFDWRRPKVCRCSPLHCIS